MFPRALLLTAVLAIGGWAADIDLKMTTTNGSTAVSFQNATPAEVASVNSSGKLTISSHAAIGGYLEMPELAAAATPAADRAFLYAKDVGGTTYLAYKDSAGAERLIRPAAFITLSGEEVGAQNIGTTYKDVHYGVDASKLATTVVDFTGYREARMFIRVDNSVADTIECRVYNVTDLAELVSGITDNSGNPQHILTAWTPIALVGDKTIRGECREGTGSTDDPDLGPMMLQLR